MTDQAPKCSALERLLDGLSSHDFDRDVNTSAVRTLEDLGRPVWMLAVINEMSSTKLSGDFQLFV